MDESDELRYGFDLLDATKIVPEEIVPVTPLGKMTLNRNPTNYFAETEQVMVSFPRIPRITIKPLIPSLLVPCWSRGPRDRLHG
jgi:catalase